MKHKKYKRFCIIDTETTGVYWNSSAPIQVAGVICDAEGNVIDQFEEKIKTNHVIPQEASDVHGIYAEDLINCRKEPEVLLDFAAWMRGYDVDVIMTYNGEVFDRPLLKHRCEILDIKIDYFDKNKFPGIDGYRDCVQIAKRYNLWGLKDKLGRKWKLSLVAEVLGIDNSNAHDAFADVRMLKDIYFKVDPKVHPEDWDDEDNKGMTSLF